MLEDNYSNRSPATVPKMLVGHPRLEHPPQGRTMIPQANDNKSLTQIRTQQVDEDSDIYSKEAHIRRGTSRGKPTTPALLLNFSLHSL
jgi:hypothetical protein